MTTESTATCPGCLNCLLTQHISTVAAALDPDRLANAVRRELRTGTVDDVDGGLILYGVGIDLAVDPHARVVLEDVWTRSADQQLRLALVHLAAALAAGAKL